MTVFIPCGYSVNILYKVVKIFDIVKFFDIRIIFTCLIFNDLRIGLIFDRQSTRMTLYGTESPSAEKLPLVLVVEDNRLNRELVNIFLKTFCTMDFAGTGEEAVEFCRTRQYAAIIMDINLGPGIDGVQATRVIRTFPGYEEIPILAVTGYAMESEKDQILAAGCSHFIPKPIEKNSFTGLIRSLLGQ